MTAKDIAAVRKLPVQLAGTSVSKLTIKSLQEQVRDPGAVCLVCQPEKKIAAFIALAFSPSVDSAVRFLVIAVFAVDRFAIRLGIASEMVEQAVAVAREQRVVALLINGARLSADALHFYERLGFTGSPDCLIRKWN